MLSVTCLVLISVIIVDTAVNGATWPAGRFNAALGKNTTQSSTYTGSTGSSKAVDGNRDSNMDHGSCTHTNPTELTWWGVDLGQVYTIYSVTLTNIEGANGTRLNHFKIYATNTDIRNEINPNIQEELCHQQNDSVPDGATVYFTCYSTLHARYVVVWKNNDLYLQLCEVEVEASPCADGLYGINCSSYCSGNCINGDVCNTVTGACPHGCIAGYKQDTCNTECPDNTYGYGCVPCSPHCLTPFCDKFSVTGVCHGEKCQPGYMYGDCTLVCPDGSYGDNCSTPCPGKCINGLCDNVNGSCSDGCNAGYHGDMCEQVCNDGSYGLNCERLCGRCAENSPCDHITGVCIGCSQGYHGGLCSQTGILGSQIKVFNTHFPSFGPVDGGTKIRITGNYSAYNVTAVELKNSEYNLALPCNISYLSKTGEELVVRTPSVSHLDLGYDVVGLNFTVYVIVDITVQNNFYNNMDTINTGFQFVYMKNPEITAVYPKEIFLSGGQAITAIGTSLNSVATPVMLIYLERRIYNNQNDTFITTDIISFPSRNTSVYNETAIVGIAPPIDINQVTLRSRRQTDTNSSKTVEYFVGFELDGVTKYTNLSNAISPDAGRITVQIDPIMHKFTEVKMFNPNTQKFIDIKGENMDLGARMNDYEISIGDNKCNIVELTLNTLHCIPPVNEPKAVQGSNFIEGKPSLSITVGYLRFHVGHVDYIERNRNNIIIGSVIGAVVLIVVAIIVMGIACHFCRKSNTNTKAIQKNYDAPKETGSP